MAKTKKEDFSFNRSDKKFECTLNYFDATVRIYIEVNQHDFDINGELYTEQINKLLTNLPLIFNKVAAEHFSTAQYWIKSKENDNASLQTAEDLTRLFRIAAITLCPEEEESVSNPYPCWWYFELYVDVDEEVFSDHGLVIKLDKNLTVLQSNVA